MNEFIKNSHKVSEIMKNFANKNKLTILCFLWDEEKNVSDIIKCSCISQSQVSQYLWRMKLEWLVESKKLWKEVYYKISNPKILEIIKCLKLIFNK